MASSQSECSYSHHLFFAPLHDQSISLYNPFPSLFIKDIFFTSSSLSSPSLKIFIKIYRLCSDPDIYILYFVQICARFGVNPANSLSLSSSFRHTCLKVSLSLSHTHTHTHTLRIIFSKWKWSSHLRSLDNRSIILGHFYNFL